MESAADVTPVENGNSGPNKTMISEHLSEI